MSRTTLKQKFILGAFTVFISLAILEFTLRIAGMVALSIQNQQNKKAFNNHDSYRILCVGESTTYLGGLHSYPNELQKILNSANLNKNLVVINKALPGIGSQYITDNIAQWVHEYQPDIVVAMMGINDHNRLIPLDQETATQNFSFWKKMRVYKLFRWLALNITHRRQEIDTANKPDVATPSVNDVSSPPSADLHPALPSEPEKVQEKIKTAPENYQKLYLAGLLLEGSHEYDKAEQIFRILIGLNYDDSLTRKLQEKLGNALIAQEKYQDLTSVLKILLGNPHDPIATQWIYGLCKKKKGLNEIIPMLDGMLAQNPKEPALHELLGGCYAELADNKNAAAHFQRARDLRINNFNPTTRANYHKIAKILHENNVKAVFVQYPLREIETLKEIFTPEEQDQILFVDNEKSFQEGVQKEGYEAYFIDRFAGNFGHGTPKGNALIAQNIANAILGKYF